MTSKFAGQDVASWVGIGGGSGAGVTGKAHVSQTVGGGGAAPANKDVDSVVGTMQNLMIDLGTQLSKPAVAKAIIEKFPNAKITADAINKQALLFSRTGSSASSRATAADGVWGKNTYDALVAIKNLVSQLGIGDVIISEGTGPIPNHTMKEDELITKARENINNLSRLFGSLDITSSVGGAPGAEGMVVIDSIDPSLPNEGALKPFENWGNRPVTMADLASFYTFFEFIQGLTPPWPCKDLDELTGGAKPKAAFVENVIEKLAREILDNAIVRLGQQPGAMAHPGTTPVAEPSVPVERQRGHCVNVIDSILDWFLDRAHELFQGDAQLGKYYNDQMQKISDAWDGVRDAVIDTLRKQGGPPVVTLRTLREATGGRGSDITGRAHRRRGEGGDEGDRGRTVHQEQQRPPLARFISLTHFQDFNVPSLKNVKALSPGHVLPEIDLRDWDSGAWTTFAQSDVIGPSDAQKYENFGPWAAAIRDSLREAYNDWKSYDHNDDELKIQHDWLNRWVASINGTIGTWQSEYKEKMERARRGL